MSSLQKFHRRTQTSGSGAPAVKLIGSEAPVAGSGFYLGISNTQYLYVAPKSTESTAYTWGPKNTIRGTTNASDGLINTNTLCTFGTAHPAAYYCKSLTTGGYNTWYLPAMDELLMCYSNKSATPFATADSFYNSVSSARALYWSSSEATYKSGSYARTVNVLDGSTYSPGGYKTNGGYSTRAVRRSTI